MSVGRSDCSIIKTHILFFPPPLFFQNIIFFLDLVPPSKKTNYKCKHKYEDYFLTTNKRQIRWLAFFPREMITNLTPCWHLVDTLLTPCWSFFQMCNCTIVTTWHSFAMPFFHCQMFSCKVDNTFSPVAMTKYFPLTSLMFTAIVELSISTLICVKKVWELELNLTNHFHTSIWW